MSDTAHSTPTIPSAYFCEECHGAVATGEAFSDGRGARYHLVPQKDGVVLVAGYMGCGPLADESAESTRENPTARFLASELRSRVLGHGGGGATTVRLAKLAPLTFLIEDQATSRRTTRLISAADQGRALVEPLSLSVFGAALLDRLAVDAVAELSSRSSTPGSTPAG